MIYYRNNIASIAGGFPCHSYVYQEMDMLTTGTSILQYKQNRLENWIYNSTTVVNTTDVGSGRDGACDAVNCQRRVWPNLSPPTNVSVTWNASNQRMDLQWTNNSPDVTVFQI